MCRDVVAAFDRPDMEAVVTQPKAAAVERSAMSAILEGYVLWGTGPSRWRAVSLILSVEPDA